MKEVVVEKPEVKVYRYAIPMDSREETFHTTKTRAKTAVGARSAACRVPLTDGIQETVSIPGTRGAPTLHTTLTRAPVSVGLPAQVLVLTGVGGLVT